MKNGQRESGERSTVNSKSITRLRQLWEYPRRSCSYLVEYAFHPPRRPIEVSGEINHPKNVNFHFNVPFPPKVTILFPFSISTVDGSVNVLSDETLTLSRVLY